MKLPNKVLVSRRDLYGLLLYAFGPERVSRILGFDEYARFGEDSTLSVLRVSLGQNLRNSLCGFLRAEWLGFPFAPYADWLRFWRAPLHNSRNHLPILW